MINEIIFMNGYGAFVWLSFVITISVCIIFIWYRYPNPLPGTCGICFDSTFLEAEFRLAVEIPEFLPHLAVGFHPNRRLQTMTHLPA